MLTSTLTLILISGVLCALSVAFMLPKILRLSVKKNLMCPTNNRTVHTNKASQLGGVAFVPMILLFTMFCVGCSIQIGSIPVFELDIKFVYLTMALITLHMVGMYDDIIGLSSTIKFFVQIIVSVFIILSDTYIISANGIFGVYELHDAVGIILTILFCVGVINAINLIDGIDGLASTLSIIALLTYSCIHYFSGNVDLIPDLLLAVLTMGALIAFWYYNVFGFKKNKETSNYRIFMGDTGALVVGAIISYLAVRIWSAPFAPIIENSTSHLYYILALSVLIVPIFDVLRVMLHRYLNHRPIFQPDKNHIHHKFMALGANQRQALCCIVGLDLLFVSLNFALSLVLPIFPILIIDILIWIIIHLIITKKISKLKSIEH